MDRRAEGADTELRAARSERAPGHVVTDRVARTLGLQTGETDALPPQAATPPLWTGSTRCSCSWNPLGKRARR